MMITPVASHCDFNGYFSLPSSGYDQVEYLGHSWDRLELEKCKQAQVDAAEDESFVSDASIEAAFKILKFARRLNGAFGSCVFYAGEGRLELVFQTDKKRLSLFVDGNQDTVKAVQYDRIADKLSTKVFRPVEPALLTEEMGWIFKDSKSALCSDESQQIHTNGEMNLVSSLSLPRLTT